ncbi:aminopeptidase P N-terminal domain-containing protein [Candidatus Kinetoplastidibacterium blastocrithidiae]|uniref:aminopeptidase P N-terminal domain-containing protein n=1 Tax=Candidatus Kinetoplastidibacterium blastocrithidiae TaxID=233181 RepID=UPI0002A660E3|nr:aminopeptidase P N-terminal domain-containing protein [Candidatus Kinetoplastibacterium blastocrithidii]AFZ83837.1 hypothetical protein CKBE_00647 [Candidatus Kinetoplastibacterium blastocrithidii (ex Strigomonas culicis)]
MTKKELWEGPIIGRETIKELFSFDSTYSINDFESILSKIIKNCKTIFIEMDRFCIEKNQIFSCLKQIIKKITTNILNLWKCNQYYLK